MRAFTCQTWAAVIRSSRLVSKHSDQSTTPIAATTLSGSCTNEVATQSAPAWRRASTLKLVLRARQREPADLAAWTPSNASSMTKHRSGSTLIARAAARKMSVAGFLWVTSEPVTTAVKFWPASPSSRSVASARSRSASVASAGFRPATAAPRDRSAIPSARPGDGWSFKPTRSTQGCFANDDLMRLLMLRVCYDLDQRSAGVAVGGKTLRRG